MSLFGVTEKKDALQPNERDVDWETIWEKIRLWVFGFVGVLLIAGVTTWFLWQQQRRKEERELKAQSVLAMAVDEQSLNSILEQYPDTDAAIQSRMILGFREYLRGRWETARQHYRAVYDLQPGQGDELRASALFAVGMTFESEGNYDESLKAYLDLGREFPKSFKAAESKLAAGRVYELRGEPENARRMYEDLIVGYPDSPWKPDAELHLKLLKGAPKPSGQKDG